jgi:hypothetical protein
MASILDIRVQRLFIITIILKVGVSILGWIFQHQWSLGFGAPLAIMVIYIFLGLKRQDREVTDEKFADSCYYLGFIFTITSIILSLFDIPNIGIKIQDIAVRFGAAMVSTVMGLTVRVYLVNFKQDMADAIKNTENAVIEASLKFREQLAISYEKLRDFQSEVDTASKATVERVNMQIEALSKNYAEKLSEFFIDLNKGNQEAFTKVLSEIRTASLQLSELVNGYSQGVRENLGSIEARVIAFAEAITERLKTTTFPDDYFAKHLEAPLDKLKDATYDVSGQVQKVSTEVGESTVVLSSTLKKLRNKAVSTERSLDKILNLTTQQQAVLNAAHGQLNILEKLGATLSGFDAILTTTVTALNATNNNTSELTGRVQAVVTEGAKARNSLNVSLSEGLEKLSANAGATEALVKKIDATAIASDSVATKLSESANASKLMATKLTVNAAATEMVAGKLEGIATVAIEDIKTRSALSQGAANAIEKLNIAVGQLQGMILQMELLDATLRAHGSELKHVAECVRDVRVVVETPTAPKNTVLQLEEVRS